MARKRFINMIVCIGLVAIVALTYVHQEIENVKTSFLINKHRSEVALLLDQYRSLLYNLSRLESPKRIEDRLCLSEMALHMPLSEKKYYASGYNARNYEESREKPAPSLLVRIFDRLHTKAEAKVDR